jgi:hypothetical protein
VSVLTLTHLSRDDDEKAVYSTAYKNIIQFIPGLKKFLPINRDGDCEKLSSYIEKVSHAHISHDMTNNHRTGAERM